MINGMHALVYAEEAGKVRRFFRDVLGWSHVDAGHGWLIFALPPTEIAAHPAGQDGENGRTDLYLMCDDIEETVAELAAKGVAILRPVSNRAYGLVTAIDVPGFGEMGLYEPKHPVAHKRAARPAKKGKAAKRKVVKKKRASAGRAGGRR